MSLHHKIIRVVGGFAEGVAVACLMCELVALVCLISLLLEMSDKRLLTHAGLSWRGALNDSTA